MDSYKSDVGRFATSPLVRQHNDDGIAELSDVVKTFGAGVRVEVVRSTFTAYLSSLLCMKTHKYKATATSVATAIATTTTTTTRDGLAQRQETISAVEVA
ncbi:hypothetical protein KIN20_024687 [Parelaphostrongylus tenuis]|uniref:Uncharacterized protein n=1 Tax=Parelaphostrongylus tenuis TaxID=148309 RepID=A0AAD5MTV4_PARTN|nr:hypothetical protein KIN20_024687 [Parelaphostrongylus tenuis]